MQVGIEQAAGAIPLTFDDLYAAEHDRLYGALFFITGSSADAEELMQDAFLKLWERWDRIDAIQDPVAYLFRVALNGFRMRLRHAKVVAARHLPTIEPRDSFAEVEMHEDVRRMLLRLPDRQRAALVLTESSATDRTRPPRVRRCPGGHRALVGIAGASRFEGDVRRHPCRT